MFAFYLYFWMGYVLSSLLAKRKCHKVPEKTAKGGQKPFGQCPNEHVFLDRDASLIPGTNQRNHFKGVSKSRFFDTELKVKCLDFEACNCGKMVR